MLNTYIKNKGITQTIINDGHNHNQFNQLNWDADYDGKIANISLDANTNGNNDHLELKLDNEDLAKLLSMESVNMPIHKRLQNDFPMSKMSPITSGDELIIPLTIYKKNGRKYTKKRYAHKKKHISKSKKTHKKQDKSMPIIDIIKNSV